MFIAFYVFIRHYICFLNKVYSFCKAEIINSIYAFGNLGRLRGSPWFEPGFPLWGELEGSAVLSQEACGQVTMTLSSAILSFPSLYVTHDR